MAGLRLGVLGLVGGDLGLVGEAGSWWGVLGLVGQVWGLVGEGRPERGGGGVEVRGLGLVQGPGLWPESGP